MSDRICLVTPTWAGDRIHFDLLRRFIENSPLAGVAHYVIVQTEDIDHFRRHAGPGLQLMTTEEVLPGDVEARRQIGRRMQRACGRRGTRIAGSLARRLGWPRWTGYTGWHIQQISKLALAAGSDVDAVVSVDSDVVVTPHADESDFLHPERIVCFERRVPAERIQGKVANWKRQAHTLLDRPFDADAPVDAYFDTPFDKPIDWRSDRLMHYLFDASDPQAVRRPGGRTTRTARHPLHYHPLTEQRTKALERRGLRAAAPATAGRPTPID